MSEPCICNEDGPCLAHTPKWCPECGPACDIDEDGCCAGCGNGAIGPGADAAVALLAACEEALSLIEAVTHPGIPADMPTIRDQLRAAISKAKGGTP